MKTKSADPLKLNCRFIPMVAEPKRQNAMMIMRVLLVVVVIFTLSYITWRTLVNDSRKNNQKNDESNESSK